VFNQEKLVGNLTPNPYPKERGANLIFLILNLIKPYQNLKKKN